MTSEVKSRPRSASHFYLWRHRPAAPPGAPFPVGENKRSAEGARPIDPSSLAQRYVDVWNEGDAARRRQRIRALWTEDGTTCHRLLDARGYDAIEARVTGAWEKWCRG